MEKNEDVKACMEKINELFFQGVMAPNWYKNISDMFNVYGFSIEVMEKLFEYCFKRNALNSSYVSKVAKTWYENSIKTKEDLEAFNKKWKEENHINSQKTEYCMITTTFDDKEEANSVIDALLEKRLVSCCQLSRIISSYHWKGKIEHSEEYLLQMKSKKILYKEVEQEILKMHSYETPQIIMYEIQDGYKEYLDWIAKETK